MIVLTTGLPGAGKTLYTLQLVMDRAAKEGREVYYSGIKDLKLPWIEMQRGEDWEKLPDGSIVVIDEAQRVFRPRGNGAVVPSHVASLETHRHHGLDIYIITQHPMLMDSAVRRLVGQHFHVVRSFGMQKATVHEWSEVKDQADKSRADSIKHLWAYPKNVFALYHSAEVHTHKRRIPMRLVVLLVIPFVIAGLVWSVGQWMKAKTQAPARTDTTEAKALPSSFTAPAGAAPAATRLSAADYIGSYVPRVEGLAYSAPRYDSITAPEVAPVPVACAASAKRCQCYSQQGTRLDVAEQMCRTFAEKGFFQEFPSMLAKNADQHGGPQSFPDDKTALAKYKR